MRAGRHALGAALAAALLLGAPRAGAQPAAGGDRQAEILFEQGKRLFDAGQLDQACARLAESDAREPKVGTLGLLAACREQQGRLAAAYAGYLETERRALAAGDERAGFARDRAAALAPRLGRLRVRAARPGEPVTVTRNGEPLAATRLGLAEVVDPGRYEIVAHRGERRWRAAVVVTPGALASVEIPVLGDARSRAPAGSPALARSGAPVAADAGEGGRRAAAVVAGGVGMAALGVGATFGVLALTTNARSDASCDRHDRCDERGGELRDQARAWATASTIGVGVGLAGLGAGAVLLLTEPPRRRDRPGASVRVRPSIDASGAGASVIGRF